MTSNSFQTDTQIVIDHFFRHEYGRIVAYFVRKFKTENLDLVEDAVQDSLVKAMQGWPFHGIPDQPTAWIVKTTYHHLIDIYRRKEIHQNKIREVHSKLSDQDLMDEVKLNNELNDDMLSMIFACCHPQLKEEYQMILTLKILCGFGFKEIARALFKSEEAIKKSYQRAKQRFQQRVANLEVPLGQQLSQRLDIVLKVIYVIFNEGYNSTDEDQLIRKDLCAEAIRLTRLLLDNHLLKKPKVNALMSLMCFHAARFDARIDDHGELLTLETQDREKWDKELIFLGRNHLIAANAFEQISTYHIQASIAAVHCFAENYENTDWKQILSLYEVLCGHMPNKITELNRMVAYSMVHGPKEALKILDELNEKYDYSNLYLYFAIRGTLTENCGLPDIAKSNYLIAKEKTNNKAEKHFLTKKIERLSNN